jgi:hypothetical protein
LLGLDYDSKDALFGAVAGRICDEMLVRAHQAMALPASLTERLASLESGPKRMRK